jgi:hypothetical protein
MAASLGFHQKSPKVDAYSAIELEEASKHGSSASSWRSIPLAHFSSVSSLAYVLAQNILHSLWPPQHQQLEQQSIRKLAARTLPAHRSSPHLRDRRPNAIFGQNELEAVTFFNDIINLAHLHDKILNTAIFVHQTPDSIAALLHSTVRDTTQGHFSPPPCPQPTSAAASATSPTITPSK